MDPFAKALAGSPALFPHRLDPQTGAVTLIRLGEAEFIRASFLDERIAVPGLASRALPWRQIADAAAALPERCGYIFHIGHVGSTLLSRLLGAHPGVLSLREPQILRDLARDELRQDQAGWNAALFEEQLATTVKLLSRRFRPGQTPLVKVTSYASELSRYLLSRTYGPRALLLYVSPENFLATILGAEHSPREAEALAANRRARLQRRLGAIPWRIEAMSIGEIVALGWACEMTALLAGAETAGARALWMDFDAFLAEPAAGLARALAHLDLAADDSQIDAILAGPDMGRYSKAPEHGYDAARRGAVLERARQDAAGEIAKGLAWLERAAGEVPAIAAAVSRGQAGPADTPAPPA